MTIPLPQTLILMDHTSLHNGSVTGFTKFTPVGLTLRRIEEKMFTKLALTGDNG